MKQNKYDDPAFFARYSQMPRSIGWLEADWLRFHCDKNLWAASNARTAGHAPRMARRNAPPNVSLDCGGQARSKHYL